MGDIAGLVSAVLTGDWIAADTLRVVAHDELRSAVEGRRLVLGAAAVGRVLADYRDGRVGPVAAQRWASFVRRGHLPQASEEPIYPLQIDYEAGHEGAIVEALARLDELGDIVDGEIDEEEASALLRLLRSSA